VGAAVCSISITNLALKPCNKFRVTKLSVLLSNRTSDLKYALLFIEVSNVSRSPVCKTKQKMDLNEWTNS